MLENIQATAPQPRNAGVFTVIWQGVNETEITNADGTRGPGDDIVATFSTEVVPGHYSYLSVDDISEQEWGAIACGEQFDGDNKFDTIDVLYVIDGGVIVHLEGSEN